MAAAYPCIVGRHRSARLGDLIVLDGSAARQYPELRAHPTRVEGGHLEMADAIHSGVPAITIIGIDEGGMRFGCDGPNLYWYHEDDIAANLIPAALERNYSFIWELVQAIDAQSAARFEKDHQEADTRPAVLEPPMLFPVGENLATSRYPKANPKQTLSTSSEPVPQGEDG